MTRRLHIGAAYHGVGGPGTYRLWTNPELAPDAGVRLDRYLEWARLAEEGLLDFFFLADSVRIERHSPPHYLNRLEPITALAAIATHTRHIGLVATISSTYEPPLSVARAIASLDLISEGRAGVNVVTTTDEGAARLYGADRHPLHADRYAQAGEFVDVVRGLWATYGDDAFPYDVAAERFLDPGDVWPLRHEGRFYRVEGGLNVQRSRQGEPVVFQAGDSPEGRELGASHAEAIFSFPRPLDEQVAIVAEYRRRAAELGRTAPLVLPGISPIVASTDEEARAIERARHDAKPFDERLRAFGRTFAWHDFTQYDPDAAFPDLGDQDWRAHPTKVREIVESARAEGLTLREVVDRSAPFRPSPFVGTAETVAAELLRWFDAEALDGVILLQHLPSDFRAFVDGVVPILQARGVYRTAYDEGSTLRSNLGLDAPTPRRAPDAQPWEVREPATA